MKIAIRPQRILDFDSENMPGFYWYDGKTTDRLHTVAFGWVGSGVAEAVTTTYTKPYGLRIGDLTAFWQAVEEADAVTGHNLLRHDIPLINGYRLREGLPPLKWPRVYDTLQMFPPTGGVSKSQENLAKMFELNEQKYTIRLPEWELASRGDLQASFEVVTRCMSDVISHMELFQKIGELGYG